jgi:hypothetical protein
VLRRGESSSLCETTTAKEETISSSKKKRRAKLARNARQQDTVGNPADCDDAPEQAAPPHDAEHVRVRVADAPEATHDGAQTLQPDCSWVRRWEWGDSARAGMCVCVCVCVCVLSNTIAHCSALTQTPLTALMQHVFSVQVAEPGQAAPPHDGVGLLQPRDHVRLAGPQLDDHPPIDQLDHPPFTAGRVQR